MRDSETLLHMKFYIVTPCFNSLQWLQNAIRSVADQAGEGIEVHHHVQDGLSTDGTPAWLEEWQRTHAAAPGYTFTYESAKDAGMYDAINTAWAKMPDDADVTAHLNSDEQYLPDALRGVAAAFQKHPKADIISCSYIITDAEGDYHCHRRSVKPNRFISIRVCELATCTTFHKAETFRRHGVRFDTAYRIFGDVVLYRDIMQTGVTVCSEPGLFTSSFAMTGSNLAWDEKGASEYRYLNEHTPTLAQALFPLMCKYSNAKRLLTDCLYPAPQELSLYKKGTEQRVCGPITNATARWMR